MVLTIIIPVFKLDISFGKVKFGKSLVTVGCQAKFLTCDIADFTSPAHAQSVATGHAFREHWLFTDM